MAKVNIPEELEALVQEYLTDGIITTKERQVLLKKAEGLGVDVDEFDLYIDAQQQKVDQAADAAVRKAKGATCPFCGAPIPMLTDKCPECGQLITAEASAELQEIIEALESSLVDFKTSYSSNRTKAEVERCIRKAQLYFSNNPKVKHLIENVQREVRRLEDEIHKKKTSLIYKWIISVVLFAIGYGLLMIRASRTLSAFASDPDGTAALEDLANPANLFLNGIANLCIIAGFIMVCYCIISTIKNGIEGKEFFNNLTKKADIFLNK